MRQTHVCGHALLSTVWEQILHLQVFDFLECTIELRVAQALLPMTFRETLLAVLKNIAPPSFLLDHKCLSGLLVEMASNCYSMASVEMVTCICL